MIITRIFVFILCPTVPVKEVKLEEERDKIGDKKSDSESHVEAQH